MRNSTRILALLVFGIFVVGFLLAIRTQAPADELAVLRALLTEWDEEFAPDPPNPLASAIFISSPTDCFFSEQDDFPSESLFVAFSRANDEGASPIRLSSLTDLISVVSYQDSRRWQGYTDRIDVDGRPLVELSRVGFAGSEAVMCVRAPRGRMLYRFRQDAGEWAHVEQYARWIH